MRGDAGRSRRDGVQADANGGGTFSGVVVDVLTVAVDGFAGVDFVPAGAAIEAGFEGQGEVGAAGSFDCKRELGGVRVDAHLVVDGGHRSTGVLNDVGVPLGVGDVDDCHYFLPLGLRFLAVFAAALKLAAVGAPFAPGLRIFSPDPAAMRLRFA